MDLLEFQSLIGIEKKTIKFTPVRIDLRVSIPDRYLVETLELKKLYCLSLFYSINWLINYGSFLISSFILVF